MVMSYEEEIKQLEEEATLQGQLHAKKVAQIKILKMKKEIERLEKTVKDLDIEIAKNKIKKDT